jgi:hypothetical protein
MIVHTLDLAQTVFAIAILDLRVLTVQQKFAPMVALVTVFALLITLPASATLDGLDSIVH